MKIIPYSTLFFQTLPYNKWFDHFFLDNLILSNLLFSSPLFSFSFSFSFSFFFYGRLWYFSKTFLSNRICGRIVLMSPYRNAGRKRESCFKMLNGERKKLTRNISLEPIRWKPSKRQLVQIIWNNLDVNFSYSADRSWRKSAIEVLRWASNDDRFRSTFLFTRISPSVYCT